MEVLDQEGCTFNITSPAQCCEAVRSKASRHIKTAAGQDGFDHVAVPPAVAAEHTPASAKRVEAPLSSSPAANSNVEETIINNEGNSPAVISVRNGLRDNAYLGGSPATTSNTNAHQYGCTSCSSSAEAEDTRNEGPLTCGGGLFNVELWATSPPLSLPSGLSGSCETSTTESLATGATTGLVSSQSICSIPPKRTRHPVQPQSRENATECDETGDIYTNTSHKSQIHELPNHPMRSLTKNKTEHQAVISSSCEALLSHSKEYGCMSLENPVRCCPAGGITTHSCRAKLEHSWSLFSSKTKQDSERLCAAPSFEYVSQKLSRICSGEGKAAETHQCDATRGFAPAVAAGSSCRGISCSAESCSSTRRTHGRKPEACGDIDRNVLKTHHRRLSRTRRTTVVACETCRTSSEEQRHVQKQGATNEGDTRRRLARERKDLLPLAAKQPTGHIIGNEGIPEPSRKNKQQGFWDLFCGGDEDSPRSAPSLAQKDQHTDQVLCWQLTSPADEGCCKHSALSSASDREMNKCSRASSSSTRSSAEAPLAPMPVETGHAATDMLIAREHKGMDSPGSLERDVSPTHAPVDRDCSAAIPSSEEAHRHTPGTWICTNQNPASSPRGAHGAEHFSQRKRDHFSPPYILQGGRETQPCCGIAAGDQEDGDGLTPRHCSSFRHTELSFPHSTGPDSEKERSHHSGDHSSQNEEEGPCSCSSALESLKGFTWGWGCQRRPAATFKYYFGELKCGLAVPMSQLPATMTCAIVANVPVGAALNGAWITGLISAVFGGSPLSITTVTSSLAVTLAKVTRTTCDESTNVCHEEGLEFIFPALILSGLCCLLLGLLRLSRFSQFVPSATIVGYLNAVAILNVRAQVETFRFDPVTSTGYEWLWVLFMIIVVFGVMFSWEKIPHIRLNRLIPSSVFAIGLSSFIEFVLVRRVCSMQTKTVASLSAKGGDDLWPKPFFLKQENIKPLAFYMQPSNLVTTLELTLALVMVNYISTLITVDMMSDKAGNMPTQPDQHLVSVGAANTVACFLGALPGSTAPSPSLLNLKVGGKGRESAVCCALVNLALVGASTYLLDYVPLGGLAGIIMYTAYHAFQWRAVAAMFASFLPARLRGKHPILQRKICRSDAFVMLLTTVIAVFADIGSAILSGVCISACVFAWKNRSRLTITSRIDTESGIKYYRVKGPIFFLTKRKLLKSFDIDQDPSSVVFELTGDACQLFDFGAMETLNTIVARYRKKNKHVRVVGMQRGDRKMIIKAGRMCEFARIHIVEKTMDDGDGPSPIPPITDMMKLPC